MAGFLLLVSIDYSVIRDIEISNYRSVLGPCSLDLNRSVTVLIGGNEAGKSNILNAISRFDAKHPITSADLSNYEDYDPDEYNSIEIVRFLLEDYEYIDWLAPPYEHGDLPFIQPASIDEKSKYGNLLKFGIPEIISFASGKREIRFKIPEDVDDIPDSVVEEFPMKIEEFRSRRETELIKIASDLVQNLTSVPALAFLNNDLENPNPTDFDEIGDALDHIEENLNYIDMEDTSDVSVGSEEVADIEVSTDEIITGVSKLNTTLTEVARVQDVEETLPAVIDQMDISLADSTYDILDNDSPILQGIFRLGNISLGDYQSYNSTDLKDDIQHGCNELSRILNSFWAFDIQRSEQVDELPSPSNERYSIEFELEENLITLYLQEEGRSKTELGQRSDGMRWILTFLCQVIAHTNAKETHSIVLLDDPGIHLHPEAEKRLQRAFDFVAPEAQIIYSTHSPVLIDSKEPDQLRIVQHKGENGTTVTSDFGEARDNNRQIDWLSVVRDALGWYWSDYLFAGGQTILVEGIDDKRYYNIFNQLFLTDEERPSLDSNHRFVAGGGDRIAFLSRILAAEEVDHIIIRDDDISHKNKDEAIESRTHYYKDIDHISDEFDHEIEIEDLLQEELLVDIVVDNNSDIVDDDELMALIDEREEPIMDVIEEYLSNNTGSNEDYWLDKGELSELVCEEIRKSFQQNDQRFEDTAEIFAILINYINRQFS